MSPAAGSRFTRPMSPPDLSFRPRKGDVIDERFEIIKQAGYGGMGVVYRARDLASGSDVALKLLHTVMIVPERFDREAETLASLSHPSIVRYVAHGKTPQGERYLVMEWLNGHDLRHHFDNGLRLTLAQAISMIRRIAGALAEAHQHGIVHRDIKPRNLLLLNGELEQVKLIDFGVARLMTAERLTGTGVRIGTPGYIAPEQARGSKLIDARADIFSLGCVFFEALSGRRAFDGDSELSILAKLLVHTPPRVYEFNDQVPLEIDHLVARMLSKRPGDRPQHGMELVEILGQIGDAKVTATAAAAPQVRVSLTTKELRVVSLVLASDVLAAESAAELATTEEDDAEATLTELSLNPIQAIIEPFAARAERLVNGSLLVLFEESLAPAELAMKAARCAQELQLALGGLPMVVVTGQSEVTGPLPVGGVIDRAAQLLSGAPRDRVRVDEATARLLKRRYAITYLDGGSIVLESERASERATPTLLGVPMPFLGRSAEIARLQAIFQEVQGDRQSRCVLVTAPSGLGKTRLGQAFLMALADEMPSFFVAQGDPLRAESTLAALRTALRHYLEIPFSDDPLSVERAITARIANVLGSGDCGWVSDFLTRLLGCAETRGATDRMSDAEADLLLMADQLLAAWECWLAAETRQRPMVMLVDDVQWCDRATLRFLDHSLRRLTDRPLLVLLTGRPEALERLPEIGNLRGIEQLTLGPLSQADCAALATTALGATISSENVAALVKRAEGNPFFLEELVRAAAEGKFDELPDSVLAIIETRLHRLDQSSRRVLRAASIFGDRFWQSGLVALLGGETVQEEVTQSLTSLIEQELILPRSECAFPAEAEYEFRHRLVRDTAYAMLTEADRTMGHHIAARWLWKRGETDPLVLAGHFAKGGDDERAVTFYRRAAMDALDANDFRAAIARAEHGIACGASGKILGHLQLLLGTAQYWLGNLTEAESRITEALRALPRGSAEWLGAIAAQLRVSAELQQTERMNRWTSDLLSFTPSRAVKKNWITALCHAAIEQTLVGNIEIAELIVATTQDVVGEENWRNMRVYALFLRARALLQVYQGDLGKGLSLMEAAAKFFSKAGDQRLSLTQKINLGQVYQMLGAYDLAVPHAREAIADAERLGLATVVAHGSYTLALTLARGKIADDEALGLAQRAVEALANHPNRRLSGYARAALAEILCTRGCWADAVALAAALRAEMSTLPSVRQAADAVICWALNEQGEHAAAVAIAESSDWRPAHDHLELRDTLLRVQHARALDGLGRRPAAVAVLTRTRTLLLQRSELISNPVLRRSFLAIVPQNQCALALADEWGL